MFGGSYADVTHRRPLRPRVDIESAKRSSARDVRWWGLTFLIQGMRLVLTGYMGVRRRRMLLFWMLVYAFVGTQMAWALRPFVGSPTASFELIRESQGTFYTGVTYHLRELLGF